MSEPKVVLVTGASSGIGRATVEMLAAHTRRVRHHIGEYRAAAERASAAFDANLKRAPGPSIVASEIVRAIEQPHRMRRPAGGQARLLSRLRRFMPTGPSSAEFAACLACRNRNDASGGSIPRSPAR